MADGSNGTGVRRLDVLIIGAGFGGLYQLHLLRDRLGLDARVVEAAEGVGGTWWWNRYPGARCDSESHSYQYFFSREIHESWDWTERYPGHAEIRAYLDHVATRLDLYPDIDLGRRVASARWDGAAGFWRVRCEDGAIYEATWLITAIGCLSNANVPDIPGLEDFEGDWFHTGRWPHEGVDFTGKRVGQIGTGSTGIQAAPVIAAKAAHLTVFQRTANYSAPARNRPLTAAEKDGFRLDYEATKALVQSTPNGHPFRISDRKVGDVSESERRAIYDEAWDVGGLRFRAVFQDLLQNKAANDTAADFIRGRIREIVCDPAKAAILSDIDHPYAAKRPPIDTQYFETFNRDNVDLVDLRADPIERITAKGVKTAKGEYELDTIVFATGFDAMTGALLAIDIEADGRTIGDIWSEGPKTYLGMGVPGLPNLFTVTGPGSPSVLCNMPVCIEQAVEWIGDCIGWCREAGVARIEPTAEAAETWVAHVNEAADATLLPTVPHSWYLGANIPGKPRVFMPYAGGMVRYRGICDRVAAEGYPGYRKDGAGAEAPAFTLENTAAFVGV